MAHLIHIDLHQKCRTITILCLVFWYALSSTQMLFVLMDVVAPTVVVEQAAPNCAAMGCGCNVNDPDRVCCCTGKTVGEVHGSGFDAKVSDLSITLSYLAASYCAGGFPDQDGIQSVSFYHVLAKAPLLLLTLLFLFSLSFPSSVFPSWKDSPPDKVPI